jgi:phosphoglycolate phosphatase
MLFDLDGTLADTAPDLAAALNTTLEHFGHTPLSFKQIRPAVSHGGIALIALGFDLSPEAPGFEERRQHLLKVYLDNICHETRLFPGMETVLHTLCNKNIPWGIVTNKPAWLTDPLMQALPMPCSTEVIVSGDTCAHNKPHPLPLLHAAERLGISATQCLYVGDAERDIQAGKAAGMDTACALFGYLQDRDSPEEWQADHYVDIPEDLLRLL